MLSTRMEISIYTYSVLRIDRYPPSRGPRMRINHISGPAQCPLRSSIRRPPRSVRPSSRPAATGPAAGVSSSVRPPTQFAVPSIHQQPEIKKKKKKRHTTVITGWCFLAALSAATTFTKLYTSNQLGSIIIYYHDLSQARKKENSPLP